MNRNMKPGTRVRIPTVEGDRRLTTYATYIGPDPDNDGYCLVHTDAPVMGEHRHSLAEEDIEIVVFETMVQRVARLTCGEWVNSGGGCMAISVPLSDGSEVWITDREDVFSEGDWHSDENVSGFHVSVYGPRDEYEDPAWTRDGIYVSPGPEWSEERDAATGNGEVVDPLEADRVAEFVRNYAKGI